MLTFVGYVMPKLSLYKKMEKYFLTNFVGYKMPHSILENIRYNSLR